MKNVRIQPGDEGQLADILPLVRAYHAFEGFALSENERVDSVRTLLSDTSIGGLWLIYGNNELVGYIVLCLGYSLEFGGRDAFVDEFYIAPAHRGKGIATRVLDLIKAEAKSMKIRAIHLEVACSNVKARELYSRANFKEREKYVLMSTRI